MEIFRYQFAFIILCILLSYGNAQNCGLDTDVDPLPEVPDNIEQDILMATFEGHNIAHVYSQYETESYTILSRDQNGQQKVSVFLKKHAVDLLDLNRVQSIYTNLHLLCTDGSFLESYHGFYISFVDINNRSPGFSELEYTSQVTLPWPIQLPIITNVPIFVSDQDFTKSSTLAVSVDRPEILTVSAKEIQTWEYSHNFKIELFMSEFATPGEYDIELTFYDGVFRSTVPIRVNVTEMVCKLYSGNKPIFGGKFKNEEKIIYEGLLRRKGQSMGDILLMEDDTIVEAYDPDGICEIEFGANVDFIKIQKDGSIRFTRDLSPEEISKLDRKIIEIRAIKSGSEEYNKIPLLLSLI